MSTGPRPSDRFIPWYIVSFFVFLTIFFAWFYHIASSTYTGLVTDKAYEKGLQYNSVIARSEAQKQLGWKAIIAKKGEGVELSLLDAGGKPLSGAAVRLWLTRPVHAGLDQLLFMQEISAGNYFSAVTVQEKGLWEVRTAIEKNDQAYQTSRRMEF